MSAPSGSPRAVPTRPLPCGAERGTWRAYGLATKKRPAFAGQGARLHATCKSAVRVLVASAAHGPTRDFFYEAGGAESSFFGSIPSALPQAFTKAGPGWT
jgi:hypothetical protein